MSVKLSDDQSVPTAFVRLATVIVMGLAAGLAAGFYLSWDLAPLVAWDTAAVIYMATVWHKILKFDTELVKKHALREDPSRVVADTILVAASVVSLAAVGLLLIGAKNIAGVGVIGATAIALGSVIVSWLLVHTIFALKYAELYYTEPEGGVNFGTDKSATYVDFAYLAFTLGMTYQVSDTTLETRKFRRTAIKHALLSYLIGTVVIATTINLIASLGK